MEPLEFAASLIRAPWWSRLQDRTFQGVIFAAGAAVTGCVAAWQTEGIPVGDKVNLTITACLAVSGVIAAWNSSEKKKDAEIAKAAIEATKPAGTTVVAGGDATVGTEPAHPVEGPDAMPESTLEPKGFTPPAEPFVEPLPAFEEEAPVLGVRDETATEGELVILSDEEIARVAQKVKELQG